MKWFGYFGLGLLAILLSTGCNRTDKPVDTTPAKDTLSQPLAIDSLGDKAIINTIATEILTTLKAKDYKAFAAYFHPNEGVLFSPYGFIDTKSAKKLTKANFIKLIEERGAVTWGHYDGSGETIRLTAQKYIEQFVYNADYLNAEKMAYNETIAKGNSMNNLKEIFPKQPFMEYYFSGFDPKHEGMDWTSLRLVFTSYQNSYYLVAVIHDQWTV